MTQDTPRTPTSAPVAGEGVEDRAREMLGELIGPDFSDTTLRVATDWLKQEGRIAPTPPALPEGIVPVVQGDRDAAAALYLDLEGPPHSPHDLAQAEAHRSGKYDEHPSIQAFARHRLAATPDPAKVREALELERQAHEATIGDRDRTVDTADRLASLIARLTDTEIGEHSSLNCPWANAENAALAALNPQERPE